MNVNIAGKTVRVSRNGVISLTEFRVIGMPFTTRSTINLALNGKASQSSTAHGGVASRAIDNNTNGKYGAGSTTHTNAEDNAWWELELEEISNVVSIEIYNRTDGCCVERLSNYTVTVLDEFDDVTFSRFPYTTTTSTTINYRSITAKKIRISMVTGQPLSLAEVRVFGTPNIAGAGTASQSSTSHGGAASRAIDNDARANWSAGTTTHTKVEDNAWWQVELAENSDINKITIHNRIDDCCFARLGNFTVEVLAENGKVVFSDFFEAGRVYAALPIRFKATGKIVRVNLPKGPLSLAEVRVFGTPASVNNGKIGNETQLATTTVFPNPTSEKLFIELPDYMMEKAINLTVSDVSGKQYITKTLQSNHQQLAELNLGNLNDGLYILQVQTKGYDAVVEKIYVNHTF